MRASTDDGAAQTGDSVATALLLQLDSFAYEQCCCGHEGTDFDIEEIRWQLERSEYSSSLLSDYSDTLLKRALKAADSWRQHGLMWRPVDVDGNDSPTPTPQAMQLKRIHGLSQQPVMRVRQLTALVQLLRDPAYSEVQMYVKLQQLAQLCAAALSSPRNMAAAINRTAGKPFPYLSAHHACPTWGIAVFLPLP